MTTISVHPGYGLYPHQRKVANDLMRFLAPGESSESGPSEQRVVAHLPTGAGKTRVATHVVSELLNASPHDDRGLIIWLASTAELCEQAAEELERAWYYLGRWDATVHRLWGNYDADISWVVRGIPGRRAWESCGRLADVTDSRLSGCRQLRPASFSTRPIKSVAPTYERMVEALLWENPSIAWIDRYPRSGGRFLALLTFV